MNYYDMNIYCIYPEYTTLKGTQNTFMFIKYIKILSSALLYNCPTSFYQEFFLVISLFPEGSVASNPANFCCNENISCKK